LAAHAEDRIKAYAPRKANISARPISPRGNGL